MNKMFQKNLFLFFDEKHDKKFKFNSIKGIFLLTLNNTYTLVFQQLNSIIFTPSLTDRSNDGSSR